MFRKLTVTASLTYKRRRLDSVTCLIPHTTGESEGGTVTPAIATAPATNQVDHCTTEQLTLSPGTFIEGLLRGKLH